MPHINRIFQSLEKIASCETRIAACIEHSELIKAGSPRFLSRLWNGVRNIFRRKAVPKKTSAPSAAEQTTKTAPAAEQTTKTAPAAEQAAPKQTSTAPAAPAAEQATKTAPAAEQTTKTAPAAEQTTKTAPAAEQAATEVAAAADPGLIARHPYLAMAGAAGTAGLATYWLTPTKHYTPPPANDYAFLSDMYRDIMNRA